MTAKELAVIEAIVEHVLVSGDGDWVGLWELVSTVGKLAPSGSDDEKRRLTLAGLERVLDLGYAEVGDLRSPGEWVRPSQWPVRRQRPPHPSFEPWQASKRDILARVETEWMSAARPPNIGDICWLRLTPEGNAAARKTYDS
jgi:hypothetical protein